MTVADNTITTVKHVGVEVFGQGSTTSKLSNLTISGTGSRTCLFRFASP
jgi:hypothetical protein